MNNICDLKRQFIQGRQKVPFCLQADAYTISGNCLSSKQALIRSIYNFTNRRSPSQAFPQVANDSRMVFYGLSDYIRNNLTTPITHEDVDLSVDFMSRAGLGGTPLAFNEDVWRRVVNEYGGYMPIKIEALPEGSCFFPNEPIIQVTSLGEGFGEMAAHIEATMLGMVSHMTARVTLERHWLESLTNYICRCRDVDKEKAGAISRGLIHDFGARASSCSEEAELLGKCHLLVFNGTDTFSAAYQANFGSSVLALAHRIVQGYETEGESYRNLSGQLSPGQVGSFVADCYNFHRAVKEELIPLAKDNPDKIIVVRPDSGDYLENILFTCRAAVEAGLYTMKDNRFYPKNLLVIVGDSINPAKQQLAYQALERDGYSSFDWVIFGVGGYLRNTPNRDSLSSAYKLCAKGEDLTPVVKLSDTPSKMSIPGPTVLTHQFLNSYDKRFKTTFLQREFTGYVETQCVPYYDGSKEGDDKFTDKCLRPFSEIREKVINDFNSYDWLAKLHPDFGMLKTVDHLSSGIRDIQYSTMEQYK